MTVADARAKSVGFEDERLTVELIDGRAISVPLAWYPRLTVATFEQRSRWEIVSGGCGIRWPDLDEDLSVEGLLRGAPAPGSRKGWAEAAIALAAAKDDHLVWPEFANANDDDLSW